MNKIYELMKQCLENKQIINNQGIIGQGLCPSNGIYSICAGRQMGHTSAISSMYRDLPERCAIIALNGVNVRSMRALIGSDKIAVATVDEVLNDDTLFLAGGVFYNRDIILVDLSNLHNEKRDMLNSKLIEMSEMVNIHSIFYLQ